MGEAVIITSIMADTIPRNLIVRAQRGSREAHATLYDRYHESIYRYFYYRFGDPYIAEDLTADVFLKMVQAISGYRIEATPFQAWLFQIARNRAIDHYRRTSSHPAGEIRENLASDAPDLDYTIDIRLTSSRLAKALAGLEDSQKDVILLRFIEGMPIAETALVLNKSIDAIKGLQRRGLITLRQMLNILEVKNE
jgi:RNA polymerase sigma-70 factor, ECF subfamily